MSLNYYWRFEGYSCITKLETFFSSKLSPSPFPLPHSPSPPHPALIKPHFTLDRMHWPIQILFYIYIIPLLMAVHAVGSPYIVHYIQLIHNIFNNIQLIHNIFNNIQLIHNIFQGWFKKILLYNCKSWMYKGIES